MKQNKSESSKSDPSSLLITSVWIVTIVLFIISFVIDQQLQHLSMKNAPLAKPSGIVALEFAGSSDTFKSLLTCKWKPGGSVWAAFSLGFDFFLISGYTSALFLTCKSVARKLQANKLYTTAFIAMMMSAIALLAGVLDVLENLMLIKALAIYSHPQPTLESLNSLNSLLSSAKNAAMAKFAIIAVVLFFIAGAYFIAANAMKKTKKTLD